MTTARKLFLPLLLILLGTAVHAHANTVNMTFINVGPGYSDGSYYVYPYNFSIDGSPTLTLLLCDDFNHEITFGESWSANRYNFADILGGAGQMNPAGGLVANGQRATAYKDAAWLYQSLLGNVTGANAVAINHTIWGLFNPTPFNNDLSVQNWFAAATAATSGLTDAQAIALFDDVAFYTPILGTQIPSSNGLPQEFIGTVPEPGSLTLLSVGLIGLGGLVRRKLQ